MSGLQFVREFLRVCVWLWGALAQIGGCEKWSHRIPSLGSILIANCVNIIWGISEIIIEWMVRIGIALSMNINNKIWFFIAGAWCLHLVRSSIVSDCVLLWMLINQFLLVVFKWLNNMCLCINAFLLNDGIFIRWMIVVWSWLSENWKFW